MGELLRYICRAFNKYCNNRITFIIDLHINIPPRNHSCRMTSHSRECCRARCCPSHHRTAPHKSMLQAANPKVTLESIFNFIKCVILLPLKFVSDSLWLFSAYFCLCYLKIARYSLRRTNKNPLENSSQRISNLNIQNFRHNDT